MSTSSGTLPSTIQPRIETRRTISPYDLSSGDNPGFVISQPALKGSNYDEWSANLRLALKARKKFGFADGTISKPSEDSPDLEDWWTNNALVVSWIKLTIDPNVSSNLSHCDVAFDLWEQIKRRYSVKNGQRIQRLKTELATCRQKGLAIETYYGKLSKIWTNLQDFQCAKTMEEVAKEREEDKLHQFLMGLDETIYGLVKSNLLSRTPLPTLDEAYQVLIQDEESKAASRLLSDRMEEVSFAVHASPRSRASDEPRSSGRRVCSSCGKTGHLAEFCFRKLGYPAWWGDRPRSKSIGNTSQPRALLPSPGRGRSGNIFPLRKRHDTKRDTKIVSKAKRLHFVLIPLMAQGHLIPMVDISKILARQGNIVTIVSTPQNASRFAETVERARSESDLQINVVKFPIAYKEFGLPENCETLDTLPSKDLLRRFYDAVDKLQEPLESFLEQQEIPPNCIISDKCLYWTSKTAKRLKIPRIVFHGMCCFSLLSSHNIHLHSPHLSVSSGSEPFSIPGIPHRIEIARAQLPGSLEKLANMDDVREKMRESESEAFGVVVNSFQELEPGYAEAYAEAINKKVWFVGPVSLCNDRMADLFDRGNNGNIAISKTECLKFLDSMRPRSVLYVCLGSLCRLIPNQLIELGLGLEESGEPFIWVIKTEEKYMNDLNKWLDRENFEERVRGRGIVIKGWSPQAMILSHDSTGGFLTHCGWNSTIEAICFGVPMITWPMFAEQFLNEKLIVEVIKIGVRVGVEIPVRWGEEERVGVLVKKPSVVKAIKLLMNKDCQRVDEDDDDSEFVRRRKRIQELSVMARKAVEEKGSSSINVSILIQDVLEQLSLE